MLVPDKLYDLLEEMMSTDDFTELRIRSELLNVPLDYDYKVENEKYLKLGILGIRIEGLYDFVSYIDCDWKVLKIYINTDYFIYESLQDFLDKAQYMSNVEIILLEFGDTTVKDYYMFDNNIKLDSDSNMIFEDITFHIDDLDYKAISDNLLVEGEFHNCSLDLNEPLFIDLCDSRILKNFNLLRGYMKLRSSEGKV